MANFRFIRRRNTVASFMSSFVWIAFILMTFLLLTFIMVCYDGDDAPADVAVIQNRQMLEEKQGMLSREDELLGLAAQLEKELWEHQERIKRRLETLDAWKKDGGRRELKSTQHHHHQHQGGGEGTEHRLKRRLMDARLSHGLGGEAHGPIVGQGGSSSAFETTTRDAETIPDVKVHKTNKTGRILENTSEKGALTKAWRDLYPPSAKLMPEKPHNENNLGSYDMGINKHQSVIRKHLKHLNESQKLINRTEEGALKHSKESRNSAQNVINNQLWVPFKNVDRDSLAKSDVISNTIAAATITFGQPSAEAEDQRGEGKAAAVMVSDEPLLGCEDLAHVNSCEQIGSGYTKRVERVELRDGRLVAVKSVWTGGNDVTACLGRGMTRRDCIQLANYKLMKEIALLQQLRHPNIIKLLGFCVKDDGPLEGSGSRTPSSLAIVEHGTPVTFINLLQMPWEDRLRVCLGISRLMVFLAESPLGSLAVHDFKLSQFVIVDGEIKLADLDDVDDNIPPCSSSSDCGVEIGTNNTVYASCRNGVCTDYSQMTNMAQSYLTFFTFLQLEQLPGISKLIGQLINNTKRASWTPRQCLQHMLTILDNYQQGKYMDQTYTFNISDTHYQVHHDQTIVDGEDYWCSGTRQVAATCVLSVHDELEAIRMCLLDRQCGAFVLSSERTWTGRYIAYFKKGVSKALQPSKGNTVYVFPT